MIDLIIISLAFAAGLVAFANPCGFATLPAYLTHYFAKGQEKKFSKNLLNGLTAGMLATLGFVTLFVVMGLLITFVGRGIISFLPWLNIGLGLILVAIGIVVLKGSSFSLRVPYFNTNLTGTASFYEFGLAYGLASLGCTLPIFLSIVISSFSGDFLSGVLAFLSYSIGMGVAMMAVTIATATAKGAIINKIRSFMPWVKKASALLLIILGIYLIYAQVKTGEIKSPFEQ